jgi:hypothetical protein
MFDSLIYEILLHIKLAEITEDAPIGFHCERLISVSAFTTEVQIFFYTIYQTDKGPKKLKKIFARMRGSYCD